MLAESTPLGLNIGEMARYPLVADDVPGTPLTPNELWGAWFAPTFQMITDNADAIAGFHYIANDWSADPMWGGHFAFAHCDARIWMNPDILPRWEATITAAPFRSR